ncbi:delta(1)-pyrroline-2-carboxylate reductase family protein, partial [Burkholderia pseudomallei]
MTTPVFDAAQTARVTPFAELVDALRTAALDADAGRIESPARLVVPLNEGGVMLSMPASAADLAIHKLVTVCPRNRGGDLPTIQGQVSVVDPATGAPLFALDGPTVTGRRTAAVTLLALRTFVAAAPRDVLLIGTGTQAAHHVEALAALFPGVRVRVKARAPAQAAAFCARLRAVLPTLEPLGGDTLPETLDA